jgi:hypothetical protein
VLGQGVVTTYTVLKQKWRTQFGTVRRDCLKNNDCRSIAMKLRTLGLSFQMTNMCLDEIEQH